MNKRIVLIEDNRAVRENTAEILELSGYEVMQAENGRVGLDLVYAGHVDLVVCDMMMPEMDGYGVLNLLRKNAPTATIPFIFLTAKAESVDIKKGIEMGADDYVVKPFEDIELLDAVETQLKKST